MYGGGRRETPEICTLEAVLTVTRAFYVLRRIVAGHRVVRMRRGTLETLPEIAVPDGYVLRSYEDGDAIGWVELVNRAMNPVWSERRFRREVVEKPGFEPGSLFVVTREGKIVGTACALPESILHLVAVLPEHRGAGLGSLVSVAALHRLRDQGHRSATLITDSSRSAAIRLYRRLGFRED